MINFDNIDDEILALPAKDLTIVEEHKELNLEMDISKFLAESENFEITCKSSANFCLNMSLIARKMRQGLEKQRLELLEPHKNFIKESNKKAKEMTEKLEKIEGELSDKILDWLENHDDTDTTNMSVEHGSLSKKEIWDYEVWDISLLPFRFCIVEPNHRAIKEFLKTQGENVDDIPGVFFKRKNILELRVKNDCN